MIFFFVLYDVEIYDIVSPIGYTSRVFNYLSRNSFIIAVVNSGILL